MSAPRVDIDGLEKKAIALMDDSPIQQAEYEKLCALFSIILNGILQKQEKEAGYRSWCVDDLRAQEINETSKKITLSGPVSWLSGGGECKHYQLDIAKNTSPLLYSYKLNNKHAHQVVYIGKTFKGWVINS